MCPVYCNYPGCNRISYVGTHGLYCQGHWRYVPRKKKCEQELIHGLTTTDEVNAVITERMAEADPADPADKERN
jgi:hypothetical protein